jgi:hypothetical protein
MMFSPAVALSMMNYTPTGQSLKDKQKKTRKVSPG